MQFLAKKHRAAPSVIIISLIDVLMVVLIFMMVSTTFKNQAAVSLTLPEGKGTEKAGAGEMQVIITVPKSGPIYLGTQPVTLDRLTDRLKESAAKNPRQPVFVRADTDAPFGQVMKITDAIRAAGFSDVKAFTRPGIQPK
jgi:biopolymer transport protein ExbD